LIDDRGLSPGGSAAEGRCGSIDDRPRLSAVGSFGSYGCGLSAFADKACR